MLNPDQTASQVDAASGNLDGFCSEDCRREALGRVAKIKTLVETLRDITEDDTSQLMRCKQKNWGHVGSLAHIESVLRKAIEMLGG